MQLLDALAELLHDAVGKSECVALFVIAILLIVVMHAQNTRRLDGLNRRLREHEEQCPLGRN